LIRGLRGIDFVGFDVVEVIPSYDSGEVTAILAANLAFEMISLSALRRLEGGTRTPARIVSTEQA
jgi:arginase family enzyme